MSHFPDPHLRETGLTSGLEIERATQLMIDLYDEVPNLGRGIPLLAHKDALNSNNATLAWAWTFILIHRAHRDILSEHHFEIMRDMLWKAYDDRFPSARRFSM